MIHHEGGTAPAAAAGAGIQAEGWYHVPTPQQSGVWCHPLEALQDMIWGIEGMEHLGAG